MLLGFKSHLSVLLPAKSSQKYKPVVGHAQAVFEFELLDELTLFEAAALDTELALLTDDTVLTTELETAELIAADDRLDTTALDELVELLLFELPPQAVRIKAKSATLKK